jgi:hypothetical protein
MCLSVAWTIVDLLSVTPVIPIGVINPFWKFAFVFKCFTDSIILDDFKTALDKLSRHNMSRILPFNVLRDRTTAEIVTASQRARRWTGEHEQKMDKTSVAEIDVVTGPAHIELSDLGGLCSPSPIRECHVARCNDNFSI